MKIYNCKECGGDDLRWDAYAIWNKVSQKMELLTNFDHVVCEDCEGECTIVEIEM